MTFERELGIALGFGSCFLGVDQKDDRSDIPKEIEPKHLISRRDDIEDLQFSEKGQGIAHDFMDFFEFQGKTGPFGARPADPPKDTNDYLKYNQPVKKSSKQFMSPHGVILRYSFEEAIEGCDDSDEPNGSCSNGMQAKEIRFMGVDGCEDGGVDEETPGDGHQLVVVAHEEAACMQESARHVYLININLLPIGARNSR